MKEYLIMSIIAILLLSDMPAKACTLWAANGNEVIGGGSLIIKNRDWAPDHRQGMKLILPPDGYRYFGLFVEDGAYPGLRAGINEKGLVVISATAGSIPNKERRAMPSIHGLSVKLLKSCSNVDEALVKTQLFLGPQIIMIADKHKVATIEIGPDGKFSVESKDNGVLFHTNHYVTEPMLDFNLISNESSHVRYNRIAELLSKGTGPYDFNRFITFSNDHTDGADNSIARTGSTPKKVRTMAVWGVAIPKHSSPEIYVKIMNPSEDEQTLRINADDVFNGKLLLN